MYRADLLSTRPKKMSLCDNNNKTTNRISYPISLVEDISIRYCYNVDRLDYSETRISTDVFFESEDKVMLICFLTIPLRYIHSMLICRYQNTNVWNYLNIFL